MILCGGSDSGEQKSPEHDLKYLYWMITSILRWNIFTCKGTYMMVGRSTREGRSAADCAQLIKNTFSRVLGTNSKNGEMSRETDRGGAHVKTYMGLHLMFAQMCAKKLQSYPHSPGLLFSLQCPPSLPNHHIRISRAFATLMRPIVRNTECDPLVFTTHVCATHFFLQHLQFYQNPAD